MMIPNIISLAGLAALIAALEIQVRLVEEPYLVSTRGDQYRADARTVGRFAPGIGQQGLSHVAGTISAVAA